MKTKTLLSDTDADSFKFKTDNKKLYYISLVFLRNPVLRNCIIFHAKTRFSHDAVHKHIHVHVILN